MQSNLPIFLILFIALLFYVVKMRRPRRPNASATENILSAKNTSSNSSEEMILVAGTDYEELKSVLLSFVKLYNQEKQLVQVKLTSISENLFALTFPEGIGFEHFCFCINYLVYPVDSDMKADVKGWAREPVSGVQALFYVPQEDTEYDNVYATLMDNRCYKIDFSFTSDRQPLPQAIRKYQLPEVDLDYIRQLRGEIMA